MIVPHGPFKIAVMECVTAHHAVDYLKVKKISLGVQSQMPEATTYTQTICNEDALKLSNTDMTCVGNATATVSTFAADSRLQRPPPSMDVFPSIQAAKHTNTLIALGRLAIQRLDRS